ncbi:MAG: HEAT repeat domain-containing protein [Verrucomicrobia bacterium]|nr:HEAT repeat domain-containing protein [Verrucomicrobiota bacterium]
MLIDDVHSAIHEAQTQLKYYPESKALRLSLIKAFSRGGNEIEALETWKKLVNEDKELLHDRTALEMLAWGVLNKGENSNQLAIKVNALIGASMTRDAKAIPLILDALRGSNSLLRSIGVGIAAAYGDLPLQEEIARLLNEEKVWQVRLELIKAAGQLRMKETKDRLIEIVGHPRTLAEEKAAAIIALVMMTESVEDKELATLVRSNRAGLRELACQIVFHLNLTDKIGLIVPLLRDPHPLVRISTLNTLAMLGIKELDERPILQHPYVSRLLNDSVPEVAITANWLAILRGEDRGVLEKWILGSDEKYARLAAGALAISGKNGVSLAEKLMQKSDNTYVQVTLALGLIGQQHKIKEACTVINKHLVSTEKWMWDTAMNPLFRSLGPNTVEHTPQIPNYPKVVDQQTRIELLEVLCIMKFPKAQEAVKEFLRTSTWGSLGAAASTLIQEGDDEALDVVRALLKDPEEKIRIEAAMILAMLGGDKAAVEVLKAAYPNVNREIKVHILEALAKVGDPGTIEFLLDRLNEPFQVLRVVAATAIIQCLYH